MGEARVADWLTDWRGSEWKGLQLIKKEGGGDEKRAAFCCDFLWPIKCHAGGQGGREGTVQQDSS